MASATLLYTARASNGWGGGWGEGWGGQSQRGPVYTPGFTSLREEGARQMRQRQAGVWRQGRNSSLDTGSSGGAEIRVEQRGGETVIEFARSGEAQGEIYFAKLNLHLISILKCLLLFACFYVLSVLTFTEKESDCSNCTLTISFCYDCGSVH